MNFKLRKLVATTLASSFLLGFGGFAVADTTDDIVNALVAKGVLTEEEGALLMRGRTGEKEASDAKKKTAVTAKFKDGIQFESGDGEFTMAITGRVHADYRAFDYSEGENNAPLTAAVAGNSTLNGAAFAVGGNAGGNIGADTFDIRRARLGVKGKFKEYYEFDILADIATGNNTSVTNTTWDNAFLNVAWWKEAQFRFGHFKMPMNLEELTSSNNIDFMERSYVNQLSPTKELGAMIHGLPFKGITYALAVSNGSGAKQAETDIREDGKDIIGRVTANFAEIMDNKDMVMHSALSFSTGDQAQGTVGVGGRTESRGATFFRAPVLANGAPNGYQNIDRTRVGVEGALAYNQFKVQGEWLQQNNDFKTNARSYDLDTNAWYLEALWTITGEKYSDSYKNGVFGAIKPIKDFDPKTFTGGTWEIGLRFNKFDASDYNSVGLDQGAIKGAADAAITTKAAGFSEAKSYTAGIKFLPNANMRYMLNYVKTDFEDVIGGPTGGVILNNKRIDDEKALMLRAQWMF